MSANTIEARWTPESVIVRIRQIQEIQASTIARKLGKSGALDSPRDSRYSRGKLKEIVIHVPADCGEFRAEFETVIIESFGGFTVSQTRGAWKSPSGEIVREPMARYIVAMDSNSPHGIFELLANWIRVLCSQECVYMRLPNGLTKIFD